MAQVYPGAGITMAKIAGQSRAMDDAAARVLAVAERLAARHVRTGTYLSAFGVERAPGKRGVTDRVVYNDDRAALSIETGHAARRSRTKLGPPRFVAGLRIMARAASETPSA